MSFGSRLRERREALGLKQSELGRMLGVTGSAIGNYENGFSSPRADVLYRVFDVLQCDANYLFQDEMADAAETPQVIRERHLLDSFRQFNEEGQEKVIDYIDDLLATRRYIKIDSVRVGEAEA
ncbi:MAG: helix-turn-helix domain-containing protein [Clostridia bacterium]|nr:helix-turn-helix domain-containing protein [Clostridia bacterium]MBR6220400.1 helix-turn-helix domain-containing protein [Clostridia bacterium]